MMRAAVHSGGPGVANVSLSEVETPVPGPGEVLLRLAYAGLNRHDIFVLNARDEKSAPLVVGSDGVGAVVDAGPGVDTSGLSGEWIINPCLGWDSPDEVPPVPEILGDPRWGTLAEYVVVPVSNLARPPAHLSQVEAGVLSLASMTVYRALFSVGRLREGEHVLIPGIGGGVAALAMDFAKAVGAKVTVTSRRRAVLDDAVARGADHAVVTGAQWSSEVEPVDVVVDTVGTAVFDEALRVLRPGGRFVSIGATTGAETALDLRDLFFRQISVAGTSMASAKEYTAMLEFVTEHGIRPVVGAEYPLTGAVEALHALEASTHVAKIAVALGDRKGGV